MQRICLSLVLGLVLAGTADAQKGGGKTKYTVDVTVSGSGIVTSSTGGISCPGSCITSVNSGTSITFAATPAQGADFTGWGGACAGTSMTCSLTISADTSLSASFDGGGGGGGSAPTITQVTFDLDTGTVTAVGSGMADVTEVTWGNELSPLAIDGMPSETAVSALLPTSLFYGDFLLTVSNPAGSAKWQLTFPEAGPPGPKGDPGADGADGADGANCSVSPQTGGALISCDDGSTVALADGQDGSNGTDGASCSVTQLDGGAVISCDGGTTATLADGQDGEQGPEGPQGPPGPDTRTYDGQDNLGLGGANGVLGSLTTGSSNVAFGSLVATNLTEGSDNLAIGRVSLLDTSTGNRNIALGTAALQYNQTGSDNIGIGVGSLYFSNGNRNIGLGVGAGNGLVNGSNNIAIASALPGDPSNTIRIGDSHQAAFIAGIRGVTPEGSLQQVIIDENGQLGSRDLEISQLIIDGADNTGAGRGALGPFNTGRLNTFLGTFTLGSNTVGEVNTAIGNVALEQNTSGYRNTAIGSGAMRLNLTGRDNLAIGVDALYNGEDTCCNSAVGPWSLSNLQAGVDNIALGHYAGFDLTDGDNNIYIGNHGTSAESSAIRIGEDRHTKTFIAGIRDVAPDGELQQVVINPDGQLGSATLAGVTDAWDSEGSIWLYPSGIPNGNSTGQKNLVIGSLGLWSNTTGAGNVSLGHDAMHYNIGGSNNVALGNGALYFSPGNSNTAIGIRAGTFLQEGSGNTYIASEGANSESNTLRIGSVYGFDEIPRTSRAFMAGIRGVTPDGSLQQVVINENGQLGAFEGPSTLTRVNDLANLAIGPDTMTEAITNSTGERGVAVGWGAMDKTGGPGNTAVGYRAMGLIESALGTTAIGHSALLEARGHQESNTAVGDSAMFGSQLWESVSMGTHSLNGATGAQNVAIGNWTGAYVNGNWNIFLGYKAGTDLLNGSANIYIGNRGVQEENTTLRIGAGQTRAFMAGIYGATLTETGTGVVIDANGQLGTVMSSSKYKHDIADMQDASKSLYALRPVTFYYNQSEVRPAQDKLQYGLIAEEVADVMPELVVNGKDGQPETVAYHALIPMLLNELQKQNRRLAALETELSELKAGAIATERLMAKASSVRTNNEGDE